MRISGNVLSKQCHPITPSADHPNPILSPIFSVLSPRPPPARFPSPQHSADIQDSSVFVNLERSAVPVNMPACEINFLISCEQCCCALMILPTQL